METQNKHEIVDSVEKLEALLARVREAEKILRLILRSRSIRSLKRRLSQQTKRESRLPKWLLKRQEWA